MEFAVQIQEMLEIPLLGLGSKGRKWMVATRENSDDFDLWTGAQTQSERIISLLHGHIDSVFPLQKARDKIALGNLWKYVDEVGYKARH